MTTRCCLLVLTIAVMPATLAAQQATPPQATAIDGWTPHVYKRAGGIELRLHVLSPKGAAAPRPAMVFFFGGAWTNGTVQQFVPQASKLVEGGMVAAIADYRVFGRHKTSGFDAIADARSAVRWLRTHARKLGIDPGRLAAGGGSAGGHVALSAAILDRFDEPGEDTSISARPDALVLFNPAVDTSHETPAVLKERFLGRGRDASPLHHLRAGAPPTLILHGRADTTVPYADAERFCAAARKLGNQCELVGYDGASHGFFNYGREGGKWFGPTVHEMEAFLSRHGYLSPRIE